MYERLIVEIKKIVEETVSKELMLQMAIHGMPRPANTKKKELLDMAKRGSPRPEKQGTLARALAKYCEHDPEFNRAIRKLRPHWFRKSA